MHMSQNNIYVYDVCGSVCVWASISGRWAADLCKRLTKIDVKEKKKPLLKTLTKYASQKSKVQLIYAVLLLGKKISTPPHPSQSSITTWLAIECSTH